LRSARGIPRPPLLDTGKPASNFIAHLLGFRFGAGSM
jgi:hypothetical protein